MYGNDCPPSTGLYGRYLDDLGNQQCGVCKRYKALIAFPLTIKNGICYYDHKCKECRNVTNKENYQKKKVVEVPQEMKPSPSDVATLRNVMFPLENNRDLNTSDS